MIVAQDLFRFRSSLVPAILAAVLATGCGDGRVPTAPVSGSILVDGKPAVGAVIVLHPADDTVAAGGEKLRPMGHAAADGSFVLGTWESSDGAPAGRWKATVEWYAAENAPANADPESTDSAVDRLGGAYADSATTPLSVEVPSGGTQLAPFELKASR
jgi:hypothetical protein